MELSIIIFFGISRRVHEDCKPTVKCLVRAWSDCMEVIVVGPYSVVTCPLFLHCWPLLLLLPALLLVVLSVAVDPLHGSCCCWPFSCRYSIFARTLCCSWHYVVVDPLLLAFCCCCCVCYCWSFPFSYWQSSSVVSCSYLCCSYYFLLLTLSVVPQSCLTIRKVSI